MGPLVVSAIAVLFALVLVYVLTRPARTIIPLYAGTIPIANVVKLSIPLPPPFNTLSSVLGAIAIIAGLSHVVLYRRGRIPSLPVAAWITFLAWAMVTTFWAVDWPAAVDLILVAMPLVVLMVVTGILPSDDLDLDILKIAIIIGGTAVGIYALILLINGSSLPIHGSTERFSVVSNVEETNPNQVAASLLLPMTLSLDFLIRGGRYLSRPRMWRILGAVATILILVAIVMSGSRGGVSAAVAGILLTLTFSWKWSPPTRTWVLRVVAGAVCLGLSLLIVISVALNSFPEGRVARAVRSDAIQRLIHVETGSSGRTEIWSTGYLACQRHCGWGAGMDGFPIVFNDIYAFSAAAKNVGLDRPAHNMFLELAVETGLVGLTLFALALVTEWRAIRSPGLEQLAPAVAAAFLALLIANIFEGQIWFKYFWLVFVLVRVAEGTVMEGERREIQASKGLGV